MPQSEYLKNLDESQLKAVEYIDGPSLVIAGAGAGKTRVLTSKIAYLIDKGLQPWNILALTFTNKAAREMRDRIGKIVGENRARYLVMGTFHSVFSKILRKEAQLIGYTQNYTIYDRTDSTSLIKAIIKGMDLDPKVYKPAAVLSRISWAKNNLILEDDYINNQSLRKTDSSNNMPSLGTIYQAYQQRLRTSDSMDFDDLLIQMYVLLTKHEEVRLKYAERFMFVLVDEYQDTNRTQARILWQLTKERRKVCVVGDDAQSIYAFRGADIGNILNFTTTFGEAKLFKLERNYRSTKSIVDAANSVISHNRNRIPKDVYSMSDAGQKIKITPTQSDREEADVVVRNIRRKNRRDSVSLDSMAVLYRRNAQSRVIEEALRKEGIPYRIFGGLSFYERKEVKDIIAYFRLVINHNDDEAFRRIINYPARGIGSKTLEKISAAATNYVMSLWSVANSLSAAEIGISAPTYAKIAKFVAMINGFSEKVDSTDAYNLGTEIIEQSGIKSEISSDLMDLSRKENMEEVITALNDFVNDWHEAENESEATLPNYLAEVALVTDADKVDADAEKVTLMTMHSAKGLEFDSVFLVGLEEEILPGSHSFYNQAELEEERRLFYVAITRAKKTCDITYAHYRFSYGTMTESEPSRFVGEIKPSCVEYAETWGHSQAYSQSNSAPRFGKVSSPLFSSTLVKVNSSNINHDGNRPGSIEEAKTKNGLRIRIGTLVAHSRFGKGKVIRLVDAGDTVKACIEFEAVGEKELLLKFAPLDVLD